MATPLNLSLLDDLGFSRAQAGSASTSDLVVAIRAATDDVIEQPQSKSAAEMMQLASIEREVAPQRPSPKPRPVVDSLAPRETSDATRDPLAPIEVGASR